MSKKVRIMVNGEVLDSVNWLTSNRSRFINNMDWKEKQRVFISELKDAYKEQANDPEFQDEISVWDVAVGDGLNA